MASVWEELKRRNVVRVAIAYAIVSWLILQLTDVMMPILNLPEWVDGLIFLLLAVGFILAIFLSWAYEMTPEGVKLEKDVDRSASITNETGRKLNRAIIGVLSVAVLVFAVDKFIWTDTGAPAPRATPEVVATSGDGPKTIAVLPFVNMSDDRDQEHFSDGLSEELLNLLAKVPELRVTSRTSAFSFKGSDATMAEIASELDVEHVLEGSVRRSGDTIRVTAQLIQVDGDTHVWSDTWDRDFNDVFAIQDEIGEAVVQALEIHLLDELPRLAETSTAAYELYLEAQGLMNQGNAAGFHAAESLLKRALEIDPEYSPAWSRLAWAYFIGSAFGAWEPTEAVQVARDAAETALRLDNANANAHVILANITSRFDRDIAGATRRLNTALELSPTNTFALGSMAVLHRSHGRLEEAIQYHETARALDPLALPSAGAANAYFYSGRREQGIAYYREMIEARPLGDRTHTSLALALASIGDIDGALTELDKAIDNGHRISVYVYVYEQMGDAEKSDQALEELLARGNRWTMEIAEAYACRGELDEAFVWLDRAMDRYDGSLIRLMYTPFMEELRADPRFDAVVERMGYVEPTKI